MGTVKSKELFNYWMEQAIALGNIDEVMQWAKIAPWSTTDLSHFLLVAVGADQEKIVQWLLGKGADIDYSNEKHNNVFHIAAMFNCAKTIAVLLKYSSAEAILNQRNNEGWTPLHFSALYKEDSNIYDTLLVAGADPGLKVQGEDAITIRSGNAMDAMKSLIKVEKQNIQNFQQFALQGYAGRQAVFKVLQQKQFEYNKLSVAQNGSYAPLSNVASELEADNITPKALYGGVNASPGFFKPLDEQIRVKGHYYEESDAPNSVSSIMSQDPSIMQEWEAIRSRF